MPPSHIAKWRGRRQFAILRGRRRRVRASCPRRPRSGIHHLPDLGTVEDEETFKAVRHGSSLVLLLCIASIGCGIAGTGLWRCRAWGHATAIVVLCIQLAGDILNVISGTEPRAVIGIPIVAALLVYLTRASVRRLFWSQAPG